MREALGQLAGLKRRKLALEMLGAAVQVGLNKRVATESSSSNGKQSSEGSNKRQRDPEEGDPETKEEVSADEPAAKKMKTEADTSG